MGGGGGTCTLLPILCTGLFYPNARIFQHSALMVFVYRIDCVQVLPDLTYWNFFREEGNTICSLPHLIHLWHGGKRHEIGTMKVITAWQCHDDVYIYIFMLSYLNELFTHLRTFSDLIIWSTIEGILLQTLIDSILGCAYKRSITVYRDSAGQLSTFGGTVGISWTRRFFDGILLIGICYIF